MRILHVVTGLGVGGAELQLCVLVERLLAFGIGQKVVSLLPERPLSATIRSHGVECVHLGLRQDRADLSGLRNLRNEIESFQPTLIHAWMYHACIYASLANSFTKSKIPQLWGIHHSNLEWSANSLSTIAAVSACRWLSFGKRVHIAYCAEAARRVHESVGYCAERAMFMPNGYDSTRFKRRHESRERVRDEFGLSPNTIVFGLVARFDPIKDHRSFLEAARLASKNSPSSLVFILFGDGMDESNAALAALIERNNLQSSVILAGRREDIASAYSAFDVLVLSSRGEAFPNVICEGMLSELPCISTNVGDCGMIIGDTGFVVPTGSPRELAQAMSRVAGLSPEERRRLGANARQRIVSRFSVEAYVQRHRALYNQLAGRSARG